MGRFLLRLIVVPTGLIFAAAATVFVLVTLGMERITQATHGSDGAAQIETYLDLLFDAGIMATSVTLIPALLVVIAGEAARIRSVLFYVAGGGLALAMLPLFPPSISGLAGPVWQVLATAGFAGGFAYWLIAGRTA